MSIDTPAKIALLGAGPMGLEAALYARFLGYDVEVFDRGDVAENIRRWGHVRMFSPFRMNASSLGLAALHAQDENYAAPEADELLTGSQWVDRYLAPLSQTDLLADHLRLHTTVVAVTRRDLLQPETAIDRSGDESPFRIVLRNQEGQESETTADVVIDTTGVYGCPNWMGVSGAPVPGESALRTCIRYEIPDILGADKSRYANRRVLVVGAGHSAATSVVALYRLASDYPQTQVTWMIRKHIQQDREHPLREHPLREHPLREHPLREHPLREHPLRETANDPLTERASLVRSANHAATAPGSPVTLVAGTVVQAVAWQDETQQFVVEFHGAHTERAEFDEIIANVGFRPDNSLYADLRIQECSATGGPLNLGVRLSNNSSGDCLQQAPQGAASLLTSEPNFYILGAKSYGRNPQFLVALGLEQIREVFQIIGGRANLDLYQGASRLGAGY